MSLSLLAGVCPARAGDDASTDTPVAEHIPDSPPTGVHLAPGVTFSGYGTVQLLAPDHQSRSLDGPSQSVQTRPTDANSQFSERTRLNLSHLSGIAWWEPAPAWKVLGEVDVEDVVQVRHHDDNDGLDSASFVALDRLYVITTSPIH